tara:strand:- start:189 stop:308 length:120 start_codon:yes stop_codon:yes gene_type:complete
LGNTSCGVKGEGEGEICGGKIGSEIPGFKGEEGLRCIRG